MNNIIAFTDRLTLRELEETDAENFFQLYKETTSSPYLLEENEYSELYRKACWTEATTPSTFNAMLFLKDSNDFVGRICMQFIDSPLPEVGIDILKIHQNKGFGPEAIIGFCNWFYKKNSLSKVKVRIMKENSHSIHVFKKLGAEYLTSTPYFSENIISFIKESFPNEDLSELSQDSINDYILTLPI